MLRQIPCVKYMRASRIQCRLLRIINYHMLFQQRSRRRGLHGQGTVGQALVSVTHHVFYVLDSLVAEFEQAIKV